MGQLETTTRLVRQVERAIYKQMLQEDTHMAIFLQMEYLRIHCANALDAFPNHSKPVEEHVQWRKKRERELWRPAAPPPTPEPEAQRNIYTGHVPAASTVEHMVTQHQKKTD